jgi:uncharacterized protein
MQMPDSNPILTSSSDDSQPVAVRPLAIAPAWHTVALTLGILAISFGGSARFVPGLVHRPQNHLVTYGTTALMELLMLGWVALGLWLRRVPFRSLFGIIERGVRGFVVDLGVAVLFWFGSMIVLASIGLAWNAVEFAVAHKGASSSPSQRMQPTEQQKRTLETLERLAPANGMEIAGWIALCLLVGPVEEAIFRGYLQRQFTAWSRGRIVVGVAASALMFGAAHGYEGARSMVLLAVFGALFSVLALVRRGLRPGILAHTGHDLFVGLLLAFVRTHHLV